MKKDNLAKVETAGSNPVCRFSNIKGLRAITKIKKVDLHQFFTLVRKHENKDYTHISVQSFFDIKRKTTNRCSPLFPTHLFQKPPKKMA